MAISLGDAVLIFKGDQTDLDAAFTSVPGKAEKSFGAASKFVQVFNDELDATGENVRFAGEQINSLTQAFRTLGVQGPEALKKKLDDARASFAALAEAGVTAKGTLLEASIKVTEREIAYQRALGQSTVALNLEAEALRKEYAALTTSSEAKGIWTALTAEQTVATEALTGSFSLLTGALTAAFATGFLIHFLDSTKESVDQVEHLSEATGLAVTQIVQLKNAMQEEGVNSDNLSKQVAKLSAGLVQAEEGSSKQLQAFKALGVQFDETTGKAPPLLDAMLQISDHLHETAAGSETLGLAYKALGRNSVELISFLGQGSAAIQEQMGHYKTLGDQVEQTVDSAKEFQNLETQIGADLQSLVLPAFRYLVEAVRWTAAGLIAAKGQLENFGRVLLLTYQLISDLADGLSRFQKAATSLDFSGMQKAFSGAIQRIEDDWSLAMSDMDETTKKTAESAARFLSDIPSKVKPIKTQILPDASGADTVLAEAKHALDEQIAKIDEWKAAQHLAFASGQIDAASWAAAQVHAADEADVAQQQYFQNLITGYQKAGDTQKAQTATQDLATAQIKEGAKETDALAAAMEKHHNAAQKVFDDWAKLQNQNIARTWEAATKAAEQLLEEENKLHDAQTKLADLRVGINTQKELENIQQRVQLGIITEEQGLAETKQIYKGAEEAQLTHLDALKKQQQDAYDTIQQQIDAAKLNPYFTDAQLADLQKNLDKAEIAILQTQGHIEQTQGEAESKQFNLEQSMLKKATSSWANYFAAVLSGSLKFGQAMHAMGQLVAEGLGTAVAAAVSGSKGFGEAMRDMLKSALASIAGMAAAKAAEQIAYGFEDLANPLMEWHAATHFLSAAKWGAVAAATAIAGSLIPSGNQSASQTAAAPSNLPATPATIAAPNPPANPITQILHLASGGLVSRPTLAIVGDSIRSSQGAASEAILPLDNPQAMEAIATGIIEHMPQAVISHNYYFKGDLIDHSQLLRQQSRMVKRGQARSTSSEALQVIRRA